MVAPHGSVERQPPDEALSPLQRHLGAGDVFIAPLGRGSGMLGRFLQRFSDICRMTSQHCAHPKSIRNNQINRQTRKRKLEPETTTDNGATPPSSVNQSIHPSSGIPPLQPPYCWLLFISVECMEDGRGERREKERKREKINRKIKEWQFIPELLCGIQSPASIDGQWRPRFIRKERQIRTRQNTSWRPAGKYKSTCI